jgi:hypothetical protein
MKEARVWNLMKNFMNGNDGTMEVDEGRYFEEATQKMNNFIYFSMDNQNELTMFYGTGLI